MNHPGTDEWMAYLYGELPRSAKAPLTAHLNTCAQCRKDFANWQSARTSLTEWRLTEKPLFTVASAPPGPKWALAALIVLGLGYGVGRFSAPTADAEAIRAAIEPPLRAALVADVSRQVKDEFRADWQAVLNGGLSATETDAQRQLRASLDQWAARDMAVSTTENQRWLLEFAETYRANRQQDQQALLTLFDRAEQKHQAEHVSLRRAVETVAVNADDKFQRTETELGHLASYAQAQLISAKSDEPFESVNPTYRKGN